MSDQPQTTEQSKGEWVLAYDESISPVFTLESARIVFVRPYRKGAAVEAVQLAMESPANVLKVSAMPRVVKAAQNVLDDARFDYGPDGRYPLDARTVEVTQALGAALSDVHPSPAGDKT